MTRVYAGIGARATPPIVLGQMRELGREFAIGGWTLRSGGAKGADQAFAAGVAQRGPKEIFLARDATEAAIQLASKFHEDWSKCGPEVRKLHGRNAMIVLGADLNSPVKFVVCWTPLGKLTGGTRIAMKIAARHGIEVINLEWNNGLQLARIRGLRE